MAEGAVRVRVSGYAELVKALREMGDLDQKAEFKTGMLRAAQIATGEAQRLARGFSTRAADSLAASASGRQGFVTGGKGRLPWYGWADFGSRTPVKGNPRSVGPWAKSGRGPKGGRFIYQAIEAKSDEIAEAVGDGIDNLKKKVGF